MILVPFPRDMPLNIRRDRWPLLALFLFAAVVRLVGLRWDQGHFFHPDERAIAMAVERISFVPLQLNPHFFAYGSFPLYVTRVVTTMLGRVRPWFAGYDGIMLTGRALSAFWGAATVVLLALLGARLYGRRTGMLAGALLAATVFHVQNSHFAISDVPLTFLVLLSLFFLTEVVESGMLSRYLLAGLTIGLAIATKFSALPILLPLAVAVAIRWRLEKKARPLLYGLAAGGAVVAFFVLGEPYAILDFRAYIHDILEQSRMVRNAGIVPYTNQYIGVPKYFYELQQMILWGMAPLLGLAAVWGTILCVARAFRKVNAAELILLSWVLPFFAINGSFDVKFMRYLLPIYPLLILFGAVWLEGWAERARIGRAVRATVLLGTAVALVSFLAIYTRRHPVLRASEWFYANVPAGARVATQHWDEGFPFPLPDRDPSLYRTVQMPYYEPDTREKIAGICKELADDDYAVLPTKRVYGSVTRAPEKFPFTSRYFYELFSGDLGYTLVKDFVSRPSFLGIEFPSELADESFSVYDHPKVLIFRNTGHLAAAEMEDRVLNGRPSRPLKRRDLLLASPRRTSRPPGTVPAENVAPVSPPPSAPAVAKPEGQREAPAGPSPGPAREAEKPRSAPPDSVVGSWQAAILWYFVLLVMGVLAFPLAHALFSRLQDRGAGFARILGILGGTYLLGLLVKFRVLHNGRGAAFLCLLISALPSAFLLLRRKDLIRQFLREHWRLLLAGEIAFAVGFVLFLGIRALNPEIYWGEKPMDYSILNILVRTSRLPPSDPWFAGAPLGYYAFGQEMIAFVTLITGLSTRYTFNLAIGLLGGAILQGAFTLLRNWAGTLRAGIAGASLTVLLGNLAGLREWLVNKRPLNWDYFWATSRVVKDTINEYPFWSLAFADLHAHVLAIPLFIFVAACALQFVRVHSGPPARLLSRLAAGTILGFAIATQALTNAWDAPLLAGLLVLVLVVAAFGSEGLSAQALFRAAPGWAAAAAAALLFALLQWVHGGGPPGFGRNHEPGAAGVDVVTVFGFFFFLAFAWWLARFGWRLAREGLTKWTVRVVVVSLAVLLALLAFVSVDVFCAAGILLFLLAAWTMADQPEDRLAFGFLAGAFFLILVTQRVYIFDRMNTFFKLYQEVWLLFALATTALVFAPREKPGTFRGWALPARVLCFLLAGAALFTTATGARGAVSKHFVPYSGPSLDGLRYLEEQRPGEYRAVLWLRRAVRGTPVVLEAQGASYQDFSRISMLTGLPTVLGWEHHVKQRGNPEEKVVERREAIREIYSSPSVERAVELLRRYHVAYVYVGWLERTTYPAEGLRKFGTAKRFFETAYENPEATVYRVTGGDTQDVIAPTRETIPKAAQAQATPSEEPEERPVIRESAAEGSPPFSGMKEPRDAAVDDQGRLWIADFGNSRLRVFDRNGGNLGGWGGRGSGEYGFNQPSGVAVHGENLYVADTWNGRIELFTLAGERKAAVTELFGPRGVAAAPDGSVWVSDTGNKRIVQYDGSLKLIRSIGKLGSGPLEFSEPVGIAVGPSGSVYVADTGNHRIQILSAEGQFLRALPVPGWSVGIEPHLEVDGKGVVYAADPAGNAVLEFDPSGNPRRRTTDDAGKTFAKPTGIALDSKRAVLYVVNSGNNTVSQLALPGKP
jgi:YYY domain-containing protein